MKQMMWAVFCAVALCQPVMADSVQDRIASSLEAQGYRVVSVTRTWLGRLYVIAENAELRREMVFNPATGEMLWDYAVLLDQPAVIATDDAPQISDATGSRTSEGLGVTDGVTATLGGESQPPVIVDNPNTEDAME